MYIHIGLLLLSCQREIMRSIVAGVSKTFSRSTLRLNKQATRKISPAVHPGGGRRLHRPRSGHRGSGGNGLCPFSPAFLCPTGGCRPGELIAQYHFTFVQTKLQLEVDQNQTSIIEQFFSARRSLCRSALSYAPGSLCSPSQRFRSKIR